MDQSTLVSLFTTALKIAAVVDPALAPIAVAEAGIAAIFESPAGQVVVEDVESLFANHKVAPANAVAALRVAHDEVSQHDKDLGGTD